MVSVDHSGSIVIWHLRDGNLPKVRVNITAPSPSDALRAATHVREYRNPEAGVLSHHTASEVTTPAATAYAAARPTTSTSTAEIAQAAHASLLEAIQAASADLGLTTGMSQLSAPETPKTQTLTRDFERAVLHDPSIWSAHSSATPAPPTEIAAERRRATEAAYDALFDEHAPQSPRTAKATTGSVGSPARERSAERTRMSAKKPTTATAASTDHAVNTSASFDIMFDDLHGLVGSPVRSAMKDKTNALNTSYDSARSASSRGDRVNISLTDLNISTASRRSVTAATGSAVRRSLDSTEKHHLGIPGLPAPVPVDNPLSGLTVWKELQSPASGTKSRSRGAVASTVVGMTSLYDSDSDGDNDTARGSVDTARQLDSLDLLQRARANMHASRMGPVMTTASPARAAKPQTATDADEGAAPQQVKAFFQAPIGDEQVNVHAVCHANAGK